MKNKIKLLAQLGKFLPALIAFLLSTTAAFSQTTQATPVEINRISNPLFIVFFTVIVFLMVIIIVLADVVKASAKIMIEKRKSKMLVIGLGLAFFSSVLSASAQTPLAEVPTNFGGLSQGLFYTFVVVVTFEIFVIGALISIIRNFLGIREMKKAVADLAIENKVLEPSILEKLNASVAIENEADILLDHNYDGIQELDNNLPPWWKYGFYLTILFAFVYLINFHVLKTGDLQGAEYTKELAQAAIDIAEYQKKSALSVDENSVKMLLDQESISKGKDIYMNNCVACHGKFGEGQVGPNFTDAYWLHGGKINDVFKTIKYGYPDKGMKSWKEDLSPSQINCVASYIKTLAGTNPANPKEKQGDLYTEDGTQDSSKVTSVTTESLKEGSDSLALTTK